MVEDTHDGSFYAAPHAGSAERPNAGPVAIGTFTYKLSEQSVRVREAADQAMKRIAERKGLGKFMKLTETQGAYASHPLGGCRMAADPGLGVTDHSGAVFGYEGLYCIDSSIIPTSLGVNPSLTIAAVSERCADQLVARGRRPRAARQAGRASRRARRTRSSPSTCGRRREAAALSLAVLASLGALVWPALAAGPRAVGRHDPVQLRAAAGGLRGEGPNPEADPYCVEFDKRRQNVTELGIVEFFSKEPARVGAAGDKCFYFQADHWRSAVVQDDGTTAIYEWDGRYCVRPREGRGRRLRRELQDQRPHRGPEQGPGDPARVRAGHGAGDRRRVVRERGRDRAALRREGAHRERVRGARRRGRS